MTSRTLCVPEAPAAKNYSDKKRLKLENDSTSRAMECKGKLIFKGIVVFLSK